jgi:gamma-glutamyltranspeptidase/glutathione hydrolase
MKKYLVVLFFIIASGCANKGSNVSLSDAWVGEPDSGFRQLQKVETKNSMVVSANEIASKAGVEILKKGGNAIDAAIATQLVLNVVEPHSSGIGGGGFLLYFNKKTGKTIYLNGRETAPANAKSDMFLDSSGKPKKFSDAVQGGLSVGTPGLLKILFEAHQKYGKLAWSQLFAPAIKAAENGFVVSARFHELSKQISYLKNFDETAKIYLHKNGAPYEIGEKITNKKLAKTLRKISKQGIKSFYSGKIAQNIASAVQNSKINPGYLSLSDLKNYKSKKGELLCADYRQYKVCTMPLPAGGVTLLQILGILENFDLAKLKPNSLESVHLITEATRLAYADRNQYLGDFANISIDKLLDKKYLKSRANLIDKNHASKKVEAGKFIANDNNLVVNNKAVELPSTTHLSVVDKNGNSVALTSSIEYFFGSAISVDGFLLNNQLTDFSFEPTKNGKKVANALEPFKQPRSSMAPTLVFDQNGKLLMVLGSPGGPRIIQFVAKTIVNHLDFGLDIQQSISAPTFVTINNVIELEKNQKITELEKGLKKLGHQTKIIEIVSGVHAISLNNNKLQGGADPRREGVAVGF